MFGDPVNNLWVIVAGLLVFTMTIAVGLLEVGELGEALYASLMKTVLMTCLALFVMAIVGFNTAFAPTIGGGLIGNPFYRPGLFLGSFAASPATAPGTVWWSMAPAGFNTGLDTGTYFLFETAFAAVTLALVGVVVLRKMKLVALGAYSIVYFVLIWNLPAAWIWNPTGWLAKLGMVDFAGGLVVHGAAGAAGLGLLYQFWREERAKGLTREPASDDPGLARVAHPRHPAPVGWMVRVQSGQRPRVQRRDHGRRAHDVPCGRLGDALGPRVPPHPPRGGADPPRWNERDPDGAHRHHPGRRVRQPGERHRPRDPRGPDLPHRGEVLRQVEVDVRPRRAPSRAPRRRLVRRRDDRVLRRTRVRGRAPGLSRSSELARPVCSSAVGPPRSTSSGSNYSVSSR